MRRCAIALVLLLAFAAQAEPPHFRELVTFNNMRRMQTGGSTAWTHWWRLSATDTSNNVVNSGANSAQIGTWSVATNLVDTGESPTAFNFYSNLFSKVTIADNDSLSFVTNGVDRPVSVSFWLKSRNIGGVNHAILGKDLAATGREFAFTESGGTLQFITFSTGAASSYITYQVAGATVATNIWTHHVWTYSGVTNVVKYYKNSTNISVTATPSGGIYTAMSNTTTALTLGWRFQNSFSLDGWLDDIRITNAVLTPAEVTNLYTAGRYTD